MSEVYHVGSAYHGSAGLGARLSETIHSAFSEVGSSPTWTRPSHILHILHIIIYITLERTWSEEIVGSFSSGLYRIVSTRTGRVVFHPVSIVRTDYSRGMS
jgi:preprotein translocase subunit SecG